MGKKLPTSFFSYLKYLYFEFATKLNRSYWFESVKITDLDYPFNSSRYKSFERKTASFFPSFFRPNHITFLRILISFILVVSADDLSYFSVFSLTVFAGLTDFIDGVLARSRNQKTRIGVLLDPLAD